MAVNIALFDSLDALAHDAAGAMDRAAEPSLYHRIDWLRLIADHCPPPGRLAAVRAQNGSARATLALARAGRRGAAFAAWYSLRTGPSGAERLTADLARGVREAGIATLDLAPLDAPHALAAALRAQGWSVALSPDKANWVAHTAGLDFDAYWAARPGKLRNTVKRKAKAAGLECIVHTYFDPAAWDAYESVYRQSWKPEEGSFAFLRALAEQEGAAGTLRLGLAYQGERPVAAQLWLVEGGTATIHKLAYVEDLKALSPGSVLGMAMFRHAIDQDRVALIDYGTGEEPYKADWMDERRQLWRLRAWDRRTFTGLIGSLRARAAALVRARRSR